MELGPRELARLARRWWWVLLLLPVAFAMLATFLQRASTGGSVFSASATLVINPPAGQSAPSFSPETYATLLSSMPKPVLQAVIEEIGLPYDAEALKSKLGGHLSIDSEVLIVTATDADADRAAELASVFAREFAEYVGAQVASGDDRARETLVLEIEAVRNEITTIDGKIQSLSAQNDPDAPQVQFELESLRDRRGDLYQSLRELEQQLRTLDIDAAAARSELMVWETAEVPTAEDPSGGPLVLLAGAFAGLAIGGGIVFFLAYLDNTVKAGANFPVLAGGPLLSEVPPVARLRQGPRQLFIVHRPKSKASEAVRLLRTNVRFAAGDSLRSLAITSPNAGEGRSTLTANLGVAMAQAGLTTVIIDADLRDPSQHRIFEVENQQGLTVVMTRAGQSWRDVAIPTAIEGLSLIPAGPTVVNPADLLSRTRLDRLLDEISRAVDVILIDTPPILTVSDPLVVGASVDGVILVCRAGRTRLDALRRAAVALQHGGVNILGVVLNQRTASHDEGLSTEAQAAHAQATFQSISSRRSGPPRARPTAKSARRGASVIPPDTITVEQTIPNGYAESSAAKRRQKV